VYATGGGQTSPAGVDGDVPASVFPSPVLPVQAQIGGVKAVCIVCYCRARNRIGRAAGEYPNSQHDLPWDAVPITLFIGGISSQAGVTIAVK